MDVKAIKSKENPGVGDFISRNQRFTGQRRQAGIGIAVIICRGNFNGFDFLRGTASAGHDGQNGQTHHKEFENFNHKRNLQIILPLQEYVFAFRYGGKRFSGSASCFCVLKTGNLSSDSRWIGIHFIMADLSSFL